MVYSFGYILIIVLIFYTDSKWQTMLAISAVWHFEARPFQAGNKIH